MKLCFIDVFDKSEVTDDDILSLMKEKALANVRLLPESKKLIEKRL